HGEGLFRRGLVVTAVCTSCHTAHFVLPHTDPRSSISKQQIAKTCTKCHARIEMVHQKVIRGELWEKQPHLIPACVDCHEPHKIRRVFYAQGMADRDCQRCHGNAELKTASGGRMRSLFVNEQELSASRHARVACVQCHRAVSAEHSWTVVGQGQPGWARLCGLPWHACRPEPKQFPFADLFPQCSRSVRQVPSR